MYDNVDPEEIVSEMQGAILSLYGDYIADEKYPEDEFRIQLAEIIVLSEKLIEILDLPENRESMYDNAECLTEILIGIDKLKKIF